VLVKATFIGPGMASGALRCAFYAGQFPDLRVDLADKVEDDGHDDEECGAADRERLKATLSL
jgi:hypothetical protein